MVYTIHIVMFNSKHILFRISIYLFVKWKAKINTRKRKSCQSPRTFIFMNYLCWRYDCLCDFMYLRFSHTVQPRDLQFETSFLLWLSKNRFSIFWKFGFRWGIALSLFFLKILSVNWKRNNYGKTNGHRNVFDIN